MTQNTTHINVDNNKQGVKTLTEALADIERALHSASANYNNVNNSYKPSDDLNTSIQQNNSLLQQNNKLLNELVGIQKNTNEFIGTSNKNNNGSFGFIQKHENAQNGRTILGDSDDDDDRSGVLDEILGLLRDEFAKKEKGNLRANEKEDEDKSISNKAGAGLLGKIGLIAVGIKLFWDFVTSDLPKKIFEAIKGLWSDAVNWVKDTWSGVIDGIRDAWDGSINWVKDKWTGSVEWIQDKWNASVDFVKDAWNTGSTWVTEKWNGAVDSVKGLWEGSVNFVKEKWNGSIDWVKDKWNSVIETIKGVIEWIKHPIDKAKEAAKKGLKWVSDGWDKLWNKNKKENTEDELRQKRNQQVTHDSYSFDFENGKYYLNGKDISSPELHDSRLQTLMHRQADGIDLNAPEPELTLPENLGSDYGASTTVNGVPAVAMKDLGLIGSIAATNSKPYVASNNADNLKILDSSLASWGYETVYTSAMGGSHRVSPRGHSAGQKVDLQLKKDGKPTRMTPAQEKALISAGFAGSGTGALGWEPVMGQILGGHYDYSIGGGPKGSASAPSDETSNLTDSHADESAGKTTDYKTDDTVGLAPSSDSVKMESDTSVLTESYSASTGMEGTQLNEMIAVQRETNELQKKQLNVLQEQLEKNNSGNTVINNSSNNSSNNPTKISSNMTSNK